jgi:hypothetical protein
MSAIDNISAPQFYHGSQAKLSVGAMIEPGHESRWHASSREHVYFSGSKNVAAGFARRQSPSEWSNELSPGHVYSVEPTGPHTNDRDYEGDARKSKHPLRVTGEVSPS